MAEQRYIQKGWEIDSITPIFKDDPSASEIGTIESVYVLTEEEWAKRQALYRCASELLAQIGMHGKLDRDAECVEAFKSNMDEIDGGIYNATIAGETQATNDALERAVKRIESRRLITGGGAVTRYQYEHDEELDLYIDLIRAMKVPT